MSNREPNESSGRAPVVQSTQRGAAQAAEDTIVRAQILIHEVANLVDGSIRLIDLARRSIQTPSDPAPAIRHLDGAHAAMSHIAALVRSAYAASPSEGGTGASSLAAAITSAVDVLGPRLRANNIRINLELDATARGVPADEVYAVVSNAVRNSIEAIGADGRIDVRARVNAGRVVLEVLDDGVGPPADSGRAFDLGFSTKPGSSGIGLALASEVITELRGTIELRPRRLNNAGRPGAILRAVYPVPTAPAEHFQG